MKFMTRHPFAALSAKMITRDHEELAVAALTLISSELISSQVRNKAGPETTKTIFWLREHPLRKIFKLIRPHCPSN